MSRLLISMLMLLISMPLSAIAQDDEPSGDEEQTDTPTPVEAAAAAEGATDAAEGAVEEAVEAADGDPEVVEAVADAAAEEPAAEESAPEKPKVSLVAEAGFVWLAGNTQSITANGGIHFGLSKGRHAFGLNVRGNYGRSVVKEEIDEDGDGTIDVVNDKWATTATRIFGDLRYDLTLLPDVNSIYVGVGAFHDPYAGYVFRFRGDVGYSHKVVNTPVHKLTAEAGFNYTRELYVDDVTITTDDDASFRTQNFAGARLFAGYKLTPNDAFGFFLNAEALLGGTDNVDSRFDGRLTAETGISANLSKVFSVKLGFLLSYDFVPPDLDGIAGPDVKAIDTTTTVTLVATLF